MGSGGTRGSRGTRVSWAPGSRGTMGPEVPGFPGVPGSPECAAEQHGSESKYKTPAGIHSSFWRYIYVSNRAKDNIDPIYKIHNFLKT